MHIYIVTREPFPEGMAAVKRIVCLAKAYIVAGLDCKVIVFRPGSADANYPAKGLFEGIPYEYIGGSSKRKNGFLLSKIQAFYHTVSLLWFLISRLKSDDVVFGYLYSGNRLRKEIIKLVHRKNACFIADLCEYPFITGPETKQKINDRNYELKRLMPLYDGVVAISDPLMSLAKEHCSPHCVVIKVPILVEFDKYDVPDISDKSEIPYIFHSGTLYEQKDGIIGMIEAFGKSLKIFTKPVNFIMTGYKEKSPHHEQIDILIAQYDLKDYIHFTGYLTEEELQKKLAGASLVIINKYQTLQNVYCFSTKLGEYMAAGKPMIITRVGEAMNWLNDGVDAYIVEPENINQLAEAIVFMLNDGNRRRKIGENARLKCHESFDYHVYSKPLADMINVIKEQKKK